MAKPFSIFLALKYLRPKRTFVSVVTLISVLGVTLGVAVLIVVISVMSGFDDMWREKILGFQAHISVAAPGTILDYNGLIEDVLTVPGVRAASPFIQGLVFIQHNEAVHSPFLKGIDPDLENITTQVKDHVVSGTFSVLDEDIVIGRDLARRMRVKVGDKVLVYSPQQFARSDEFHLPEELTVAGIFDVGMWDFDMGYLLSSLGIARNLSGIEQGVQGIQVMTDNPLRAEQVAERLREHLGPIYEVQSWMTLNRQLFATLRVEKNLMGFLLGFILLVAAFSIMNTLITVTVQKTREIGLLKAVGFSSGSVMRVFLWQGWVAGMIGLVCGNMLGLFVLHHRNNLLKWLSDTFHLELFPKNLYRLAEIPASTRVDDLLLIAAFVMLLCTLAGLIPAWRASRLNPSEALRYE